MILFIILGLALLVAFAIAIYAALIVASDYDDAMEELNEEKDNDSTGNL